MEKSLSWKKKKYLQAFRILENFDKPHNFCNIHKNNGIITCNGCFNNQPELCCKGCSNLTKTGCKAKSLSCKMSFCYFAHGPYSMRLTSDKELAERRLRLVQFIKQFLIKNNIPFFGQRISMNLTFLVYTKKIDIENIGLYSAKVKK